MVFKEGRLYQWDIDNECSSYTYTMKCSSVSETHIGFVDVGDLLKDESEQRLNPRRYKIENFKTFNPIEVFYTKAMYYFATIEDVRRRYNEILTFLDGVDEDSIKNMGSWKYKGRDVITEYLKELKAVINNVNGRRGL